MALQSSARCIAKNTLMLYFRQILIMLVSLYTVRVALSVLGAEDYGIYNVVAGVVTMFGFLSGAMATASQRYFSFDLGKNDLKHLNITFNVTFQIYLVLSIAIVLVSETLGLWFVNTKLVIPSDRIIAANYVYQGAIISFLFSILATPYIASIVAHEDMNAYAYVSIVEALLKLGIVFLLKLLPFDKLALYGLLFIFVSFVSSCIYWFWCHKKYNECRIHIVSDWKMFKEIISYSSWNLFGASVSIVKNQIMNLLLNLHFGAIVNTARGIAVQVNNATTSFSRNFSTALNPQIIKNYAAENRNETFMLVFRGCRFTYYLMWVFALPLILEMELVLTLWLKNLPDYVVIFTRLVIIDAVIETISYPLMTLAQATGKIKLYQGLIGGIMLLNLPVSLIALKYGAPAYSVMLIAIALSIIAFFVRLFLVHKLTKLSLQQFCIKTVIPIILVTCFSMIIPIVLYLNIQKSFMNGLFVIVISVLSVCLCVFFIGMKKEERIILFEFVKKTLSRTK